MRLHEWMIAALTFIASVIGFDALNNFGGMLLTGQLFEPELITDPVGGCFPSDLARFHLRFDECHSRPLPWPALRVAQFRARKSSNGESGPPRAA